MYWKEPAFRLARVWSTYLPHCGQRGKPVCAITTLRTKLWTLPGRYPRACDILFAFKVTRLDVKSHQQDYSPGIVAIDSASDLRRH